MQFREFAEALLGSKVKVKLIRHLLVEEAVNGEREVAKRLGVSHVAVHRILLEFHESNLITPIRVGNVKIWHLNKQSYAYQFLRPLVASIKTDPLEDLKVTIRNWLGNWREVRKVIIFGSVAEGKEAPESDIDLFILVDTEEERRHLLDTVYKSLGGLCLMRYGNKLSAQFFTSRDIANKKNKTLLQEVAKGITVIEK